MNVLLVFGLALLAVGVKADHKCQGKDIQTPPKTDEAFQSCLTSMKIAAPANKEEGKKLFKNKCFMVCIWENLGILANGTVNNGGLEAFIRSVYPGTAVPAILEGAGACVKNAGKLEKADDCKSYGALMKCVKGIGKTICKLPAGSAPAAAKQRRRRATGGSGGSSASPPPCASSESCGDSGSGSGETGATGGPP